METTTDLVSIINADMLKGVLDQVLGVMPVVIPAVLGFMGIRKGISFVLGMVKKA